MTQKLSTLFQDVGLNHRLFNLNLNSTSGQIPHRSLIKDFLPTSLLKGYKRPYYILFYVGNFIFPSVRVILPEIDRTLYPTPKTTSMFLQ